MNDLDRETIKHLAKLCRIHCSQDQEETFLEDLQKVLGYVERLNDIDTEGVACCNHVISSMVNVEREDQVGATLQTKTFLENSPAHKDGMVLVPPVIKNHVS